MVPVSRLGLGLTVVPIFVLLILNLTVGYVFAQESAQNLLIRRVAIWDLFYRGMVAAFVVGALVQGSIIYVGWRFRESNKKNQPPSTSESVSR
jgi:heme/copper-type cytochrome/quinol oxidase subunit 2